ncbi:EamA family transporter RarD [Rhodopirellula sp. MGV]|uniref:EamA family transporter RarD n=1 Tax=Rhodopirellula sp. MGV TaxID=2023130 RepID=UPI000B965963|nr:EamA family transporter RarD [Rhodopirellula sp. MGV]OYP36829.1 protein RarD [Rhodopirellula sp. MGV]PNY36464.1 EamA family transporter RarD [Rhodopirellula baltica]
MFNSTQLGFAFAIIANTIWGVFPIFWSFLRGTPALELVCHRIAWAFAFSLLIAAARFYTLHQDLRKKLLKTVFNRKTLALYAGSAILIAINWLAFLWAVTHDRVLLSSLGYYINPLFNVLLGVLVLGETLRASRWVAIGFATVGVAVMAIGTGEFPWVSLFMASSFAGYALLKKKAQLDVMYGLLIETAVLIIPTIIYLGWLQSTGEAAFSVHNWKVDALLMLGGMFTLIPLALFSAATQRVPLSVIGVLQYVGPTLQFICGVAYFGETVSVQRMIGFAFVWVGVAIFLFVRNPQTANADDADAAIEEAERAMSGNESTTTVAFNPRTPAPCCEG